MPWYRELDFPIVVANMPPTARHRRVALIAIGLLLLIALISAPFATMPLPHVSAFIPVLQALMCMADVIAAVFFFAQYLIQPRWAMLALASGYMSGGLFAFLQTLAFPGAYAPHGLIGDGPNSSAGFFILWRTTFPLGVLVYALWKDADGIARLAGRSNAATVGTTIVCVLLVDAALAWLAAKGTAYLPAMYESDLMQQTTFARGVNLFLLLWGMIAIVALFVRRRTILDLWLIVTLVAWVPNFFIAVLTTTVRFTLVWYLARGYALVATFMLLSILLAESALLYSRLATAILLQRRERMSRLMSLEAATGAIAHELAQPLMAIKVNSDAAARFLGKTPPGLQDIGKCLHEISSSSERAADVIASIRALFKDTRPKKASVVIDQIVQQALTLAKHDLQVNQVSVTSDFHGRLPAVEVDPVQIQQVLLNLIKNAIDAMAATPSSSRALRVTISRSSDADVRVMVEDTGPGLAADADRIFEPFVTTKADGMGLGLAISRTIVENHGGMLRVVKTGPHGTTFELALPINGAQVRRD